MDHSSDPGRLDPITVEVIRNKLDGIAKEMAQTLIRSAFSSIVKEANDASASLFTIGGETLAQAIAVPAHMATLYPMVSSLLKVHPVASMSEGDIFIMNDPYDGGSHLPDVALVMPVFHRGRPIALSTSLAHHLDIGGMSPGSVPPNATEVFQEGMRIPPMKYRDKGVLNETLLMLLKKNVRTPDMLMGDLNAQVASCSIAARRLIELADSYGGNFLLAVFDELLNRSETMTKKVLRSLPEGTYRYVDYLDNDGVELEKPIRIEVAVTLADGTMTCDFNGTSPQVRGPFNCVPAAAYASAAFAVCALAGTDIPSNGGVVRPLRFNLPEGSLVNPREPAAVSCRSAALKRIAGCILGALRQAAPERIAADGAGVLVTLHFAGERASGGRFVVSQFLVGGSGASEHSDGVDVIETDVSNVMNMTAEAFEMDSPVRININALRPDSGGVGRYRGGLGCIQEFEALEGDVLVTFRGERHFFAAKGVDGGGDGARSIAVIRRVDGTEETIPSKQTILLRRGDRLYVETPGGGGHGPTSRRDQDLLAADLRNEKVSPGCARELYGAHVG